MNDDQVLSAARNALADVRLGTPLAQTMDRGGVLRSRRRRAIASTAALAGAGALVVAIAATAAHPGDSGAGSKLVAWTVTEGPKDTVTVTVRQTYDADGLQRTLRGDGIPIRVAFAGDGTPEMNPTMPQECHTAAMSDQANAAAQARILGMAPSPFAGIALTINKREIPAGVGLFLAVYNNGQSGSSSTQNWGWGLDLVQATPACTG